VNALTCSAENATRQPGRPPKADSLKEAAIANGSLKLHLRRARRDLVGSQQIIAVNRLLDATDAFGRALEWLRGGHGATDVCVEQLAMESQAIADAVEVVAQ
jgi:hypothetical protein